MLCRCCSAGRGCLERLRSLFLGDLQKGLDMALDTLLGVALLEQGLDQMGPEVIVKSFPPSELMELILHK